MSEVIQDVSEAEVNALTQSILARYGIDFTCYEPKSLRRRIIRILNRFNLLSIHELWVQFLRDSNFVHIFMNEVSVGMTSMFRDPILWKKLKTRIEKDFTFKKPLKAWHAGCSTGEEVYSFGILLKEINMLERSEALATDFNKDAIEEARKGIYHKIKMIENEANYLAFNPFVNFTRYYTSNGKYAQMDLELIKHATFDYHNLITDSFHQSFDIIFCRNVMIYFDSMAKSKLLDKFYGALNPNGLLIIGFFDTMGQLIDSNRFQLVDEEAKIFRRLN
jgi:chemotaxis protein methyltransferase CheR